MTENLFAKFDQMYDVAGLKDDIKKAAENQRDYEEVPDGDYEVAITKMEAKTSSNGNPMVTIWFKIVNGSHKGSIIFANLTLTSAYGIHKANEVLRSVGVGVNVSFESFSQYACLIADVFEASKSYEYALEYTHNSKGYAEYKINDVFELN